MIELLILGAIALVVLGRLYTELGKDDGPPEGRDRRPMQPPQTGSAPQENAPAAGTPAPARGGQPHLRPAFTGPAAAGLEDIRGADREFNPNLFLSGAKSAYEMIVNAFAEGDLATLKPLLADEVYGTWSAAVEARSTDGPTPPTLLRVKSAEIDDAELDGDVARVDVLFSAELGDGDRVRSSQEIWTFERDITTGDPNWQLAAVDTPS